MRSIRIGIDARMFSDAFTGIGRYNFELTKRLFSRKSLVINGEACLVEWVIFLNDPQYGAFDFPENVKKIRVNAGHYSLAEQSKFLWTLWREKCDLVHFTHFNLPLFYRKSFVVTIHDTTISFYPGKKMNNWYRKLGYRLVISNAIRSSKRIMTVSKNTKADVLRLFGVDSQKIEPIWIAPAKEFGPASAIEKKAVREKFGLPEEFLLYTGNWREHKNLPRLIRAFSELVQDRPDLGLVLTGKPDPYYPEVVATIEALGLQHQVYLLGLVDFADLKSLSGAARLYVFPTLYEGFGLPPLEAMACHTPVAASRVSSVPEVCGEAVAYFDPENVADMRQVIEALLDSPEARNALVREGVERIKLFDWDVCANRTAETYCAVLR